MSLSTPEAPNEDEEEEEKHGPLGNKSSNCRTNEGTRERVSEGAINTSRLSVCLSVCPSVRPSVRLSSSSSSSRTQQQQLGTNRKTCSFIYLRSSLLFALLTFLVATHSFDFDRDLSLPNARRACSNVLRDSLTDFLVLTMSNQPIVLDLTFD